jgi:hypothetical protein
MTLQDLLATTTPGEMADTTALSRCVAECWDSFEGSDEGGMQGYKLINRMERVQWQPPQLSFVIERHGGLVLGSSRAELQTWVVNLVTMTAGITNTGRRQITAMAPRQTKRYYRIVAEELADIIEGGGEDERLRWKPDGRVHVIASTIIDGGPQRTVAGRRIRLRGVLEEVLGTIGWNHEGRNVFRRRAS